MQAKPASLGHDGELLRLTGKNVGVVLEQIA